MIQLTRFNNETVTVNVDLVVRVEANPDTILHMTNGDMVKVRETPEDIVQLTIAYKRLLFATNISQRGDG